VKSSINLRGIRVRDIISLIEFAQGWPKSFQFSGLIGEFKYICDERTYNLVKNKAKTVARREDILNRVQRNVVYVAISDY
jgi:hypothetical protein